MGPQSCNVPCVVHVKILLSVFENLQSFVQDMSKRKTIGGVLDFSKRQDVPPTYTQDDMIPEGKRQNKGQLSSSFMASASTLAVQAEKEGIEPFATHVRDYNISKSVRAGEYDSDWIDGIYHLYAMANKEPPERKLMLSALMETGTLEVTDKCVVRSPLPRECTLSNRNAIAIWATTGSSLVKMHLSDYCVPVKYATLFVGPSLCLSARATCALSLDPGTASIAYALHGNSDIDCAKLQNDAAFFTAHPRNIVAMFGDSGPSYTELSPLGTAANIRRALALIAARWNIKLSADDVSAFIFGLRPSNGQDGWRKLVLPIPPRPDLTLATFKSEQTNAAEGTVSDWMSSFKEETMSWHMFMTVRVLSEFSGSFTASTIGWEDIWKAFEAPPGSCGLYIHVENDVILGVSVSESDVYLMAPWDRSKTPTIILR